MYLFYEVVCVCSLMLVLHVCFVDVPGGLLGRFVH